MEAEISEVKSKIKAIEFLLDPNYQNQPDLNIFVRIYRIFSVEELKKQLEQLYEKELIVMRQSALNQHNSSTNSSGK